MKRNRLRKNRLPCLLLSGLLLWSAIGAVPVRAQESAAAEALLEQLREQGAAWTQENASLSAQMQESFAAEAEGVSLREADNYAQQDGLPGETRQKNVSGGEDSAGEAAEFSNTEEFLGTEEITGSNWIDAEQGLGEGSQGDSTAFYYAAANGESDGALRDQLTDRQKEFYDALSALTIEEILMDPSQSGYFYHKFRFDDSFPVPVYGLGLTGSVNSKKQLVTDAASKPIERALYTDLTVALEAVREDHPDMIWLTRVKLGYNWSQLGTNSFKVTDVQYGFYLYGYDKDGLIADIWKATNERAKTLADALMVSGLSLYDQLNVLYRYLGETNSYNKEVDAVRELVSHWAYSALVGNFAENPYKPVCDGYSKAFKLVLDAMGVPCVLPVSDTHMWNNVKMDDGKWYNIDVTWGGDNNKKINFSYFMVGSQTLIEESGTTYEKLPSHTEANPYRTTDNSLDPYVLRFPVKSTHAYINFPDVSPESWFFGDVKAAKDLDLMSGDKSGTFRPEESMSRAEVAQTLANAYKVDLSLYEGRTSAYIDVQGNEWFAPAVAWAWEQGYMKGDAGKFRPFDPIIRQEICVIFHNLAGNPTSAKPVPAFGDAVSIADWAKAAVRYCGAEGILRGDRFGNCLPWDNIKRCETAAIFVRNAKR